MIFDSAYDAIFLHDMDGCVLDVNSRMLALYGLEKEEAEKICARPILTTSIPMLKLCLDSFSIPMEVQMRNVGWWLAPLLISLQVFFFAPPAAAQNFPNFVTLAKQLKPAVVNISTTKNVQPRRPIMPGPRNPRQDEFFEDFFEHFFGGAPRAPRKERSLGSGFIISREGYILTNNHVIEGADEVKVTLEDGREFVAEVKGLDPKLDVALLKVDAGGDLPVAELGDSNKLQVGEWVLAIGNPFGLEETVTAGIVSAKERVIGAGPYDDFIQTDASINPGNSGGPLFDMDGKVVGINTAIVASGQGIGFATPINAAKLILRELRETGRVTRGWLGVAVQEMTPELAKSFGLENTQGALVSEVVEKSPAAKAGIQRGDIILSFAGKPVQNVSELPRIVAATPVGEKATIEIFRNGKRLQLPVIVARLDEPEAGAPPTIDATQTLGLTVGDVTAEAQRYYRLERDRGALVTAVEPAGPADEAEIRPGDLIVEVNGQEIANAEAFRRTLAKAQSGTMVRLLIQRADNLFYTTVPKP